MKVYYDRANTLRFLWSILHEDKAVKAVRLAPCCKRSTLEWSDSIHEACGLGSHQEAPLPPFSPPPGPAPRMEIGGFDNAAIAMAKLSDAWERKIEMEVLEKEDRDLKKKEKSFEKLADVQKKALVLITATSADTDRSFDEANKGHDEDP